MATIRDQLDDVARRHPIPGFLTAASRDGELIHQSAHGLRNAETGEAMSAETVFRIFSMTKAVTATAVLQLVERGRVSLDAPAASYAPEIAKLGVLVGFDADDAPVQRPALSPITLRHLLTHCSGFGYMMWNADLAKYQEWAARTKRDRGLSPLLDLPPVFDPGERWEYGVGLDWAGHIVERTTGMTLAAYFREHIFEPLGMSDTGFALSPEMAARLSDQHTRGPDGAIVRQPRMAPSSPPFCGGGGGLIGTAPDYLRFLEAIAGDGSARGARILSPDGVEHLARIDSASPRMRRLPTAMPAMTNDLDIWDDDETRWSLAFMVNPKPGPHGRSAGSLAWGGLANTYYWVDRPRRLAGVLMTQLSPFADPDVLAVFAAFERAVYAML